MKAGEELLRKGRALLALGDAARAEATVAAGLDVERGSGSDLEVALAVELARLRTTTQWSSGPSLAAARLAVALAESRPAWQHHALLELAKANLITPDRCALGQADAAFRGLRASGDVGGYLEAATWLVQMQFGWGDLRRATALARWIGGEAELAGMRPYVATARWQEARLRWLGGDTSADALAAFRRAVADPALAAFRAQARSELAVAHADAGENDTARELLRSAATLVVTPFERDVHAFYRAEVEFLGGRPRQAVAAANESFGSSQGLAHLAASWALVLGGEQPLRDLHAFPGTLTGLPAEREGLISLAAGRYARAADAFLFAAGEHEPHLFRHRLRCLLGAGASLVRAGAVGEGRRVLREAEAAALRSHSGALLGRIRVLLGEAACGRAGAARPLTPRQNEVLRLVAAGHSTKAIAAQLGLAPSSVETHVRQARAKLGTGTRREAALAYAAPAGGCAPLRHELATIATMLAGGATLDDVAAALRVSRRTAARRVAELRTATGTRSTTAAVSLAVGRH